MNQNSLLIRRSLAATIDYLFYLSLLLIYSHLRGNADQWDGNVLTYVVNSIPGFLIVIGGWLIYFPLIEAIFGYTLGKALFDLEVVRENKNDFPLGTSLKRHLLDPIDFLFFGLFAVLLVKFSEDHKRLGDRWAGTQVLREGERIIPQPIDSVEVLKISRVVYGGFWPRLAANIIDGLVMIPLAVLFLVVVGSTNRWMGILAEVILSFLVGAYTTILHAKYGATLGKMAAGLIVRKVDLSQIGWPEALKRSSVDYVFISLSAIGNIIVLLSLSADALQGSSMMQTAEILRSNAFYFFAVVETLSIMWFWSEVAVLLFNKKRRAIHDFIAGTVVVQKDTLTSEQLSPSTQRAT